MTKINNDIINKTIEFVIQKLAHAEWWHDYRHIERVRNNAKHIAHRELWADMLIVELWALLHDIADSKFHEWNEEIWPQTARKFLESLSIQEDIISHVENIVRHISFKWWRNIEEFRSLELNIVQDADRLDAIGAIGIARTFNYGGFKWRELYNPNIRPNLNMTKEEYKNSSAPTLNHFYEKLLLLKDKMNTTTWKRIAEHRHNYMLEYLREFYWEREWKL